jgi:succinate dehydrogenase / fumarate reductase flavoprotein subunit
LGYDALNRDESCGAHFRVEHQTAEGEAVRNDKDYCYVAAWEFKGVGQKPELHKEPLTFETLQLVERSYK